jgi:hypothetical protein
MMVIWMQMLFPRLSQQIRSYGLTMAIPFMIVKSISFEIGIAVSSVARHSHEITV